MLALRIAALAAIALWSGGIVALGAVAAPAIFDTLASRGVADARAVAGAVFGETLRRFHAVSYGCAGVVIGTLLLRRLLGPRPSRLGIRLAISSLMAGAAVYSGTVLAGRIERARDAAGGSPSTLAAHDPRRTEFDRLHALSTTLAMVPVLGGVVLIGWELRE